MGFIVSPFVSPFLLGYMIEHTTWRDVYWVGVGYCAVVVLLLTFVMEETIYDRDLSPVPPRHATGFRYRFDTLIGITGARMAKYRPSLWAGCVSLWDVLWRPHAFACYVYIGWIFGCGASFSPIIDLAPTRLTCPVYSGIGINVTNAVRLESLAQLALFRWS